MKLTTLALFAAFSTAVTGGGVYAVTPDGGFARSGAADASASGAPSPGDPAAADAPQLPSEFVSGSVLRVEGRMGHPTIGASGRETFVLLEVRADAPGGTERSKVDLAIAIDKSGSMTGTRIENARRAAIGAVERLRDGDTVSVVAFDTTPELVVRSTPVTDASRRGIVEAIRGIALGGDTCISCGLEAGMKLLQDGARDGIVRRVLLLSDGQPTSGVADAKGFRSIGERALAGGTSITTVGVDLAYNEEIMSAIAIASNGGHHFVESDADLPRVFEAEATSLASTVAGGATAEIELAPGVELVQLFDRPFNRSGGRLSVPLGDLSKGDVRTVLLKVRVPGGAPGVRDVASARVTFRDLGTGQESTEKGALGVVLAQGAVPDAIDAVVLDRVQRSETTSALQEANSLFARGKADLAQRRLEDARRSVSVAREGAKASAPKGRGEKVDQSLQDQESQLDDAVEGFAAPKRPSPASGREQEKSKKQNAARSRANML